MTNKKLTILITRPKEQAKVLCEMITKLGHETILFPTMEIEPIVNDQLKFQLQKLANYDFVIFTSQNAVIHSINLIKAIHSIDTLAIKFVAIGAATKRLLESKGISVIETPQKFNSENLLAMPYFQKIKDKKILIISGLGGREYIEQNLARRGALVEKANCYKRIMPNVDIEPLLATWQSKPIDIVVCTSFEGLYNLYQLIGKCNRTLLLKTSCIVISDRIAKKAQDLGLTKLIVTQNAEDSAIITTINEMKVKG